MAIGHIAVRTHSRKQGHSVAGALAYRFGLSLKSERTGETFDFSRRSDRENIAATGLSRCPFDTVDQLADAIEGAERRKDSRILRDVQMALPAELDEADRAALAQRFAAELATRYETVTAWAVHRPDKRSDERNHHAHIVLPTRRLDDTGQAFGAKLVQLDDPKRSPAELTAIRELWETLANQALRQAKSEARVHTGRTSDPIPTIPREHVAVERRAWSKRNKRHPRGLSVPELVADGCATGPGRHLAQHVRTRTRRRRRRQDPAHDVPRVSPAEVRLDAEISSKTPLVDSEPLPSAPLSEPLLSVPEELAAVELELAELERRRVALAPVAEEEIEIGRWDINNAGTVEIAPAVEEEIEIGRWDINAASAVEPEETPLPVRTRDDFSLKGMLRTAKAQREAAAVETSPEDAPQTPLDALLASTPDAPVAHDDAHSGAHAAPEPPAETDTEIGEFEEIGAWTLNDEASARDAARTGQAPNAPDAHAPDQGRDRGPLTPDTAPAESPRETEDPETVPTDEIAQQRRRAGPAVNAHAANNGRAPADDERARAMQYLKGGYNPDGTPRPALGSAVDQCARAAFVGQTLAADPLAQACASTAAAAEARRMTVASVETFKRQHPPQRGIISALEEWRRTLRPGLMKKILTVIVPLEVQHNRRRRSDQAQRPSGPGPDFGI